MQETIHSTILDLNNCKMAIKFPYYAMTQRNNFQNMKITLQDTDRKSVV